MNNYSFVKSYFGESSFQALLKVVDRELKFLVLKVCINTTATPREREWETGEILAKFPCIMEFKIRLFYSFHWPYTEFRSKNGSCPTHLLTIYLRSVAIANLSKCSNVKPRHLQKYSRPKVYHKKKLPTHTVSENLPQKCRKFWKFHLNFHAKNYIYKAKSSKKSLKLFKL